MHLYPIILRVAVPSPLRYLLDYLPPTHFNGELLAGMRVRIPLQKRHVIGVIVSIAHESRFALERLRSVSEIIDTTPIISADILALANWASKYYHHPIGEVFETVLPNLLRQGKATHKYLEQHWQLSTAEENIDLSILKRSPQQMKIFTFLREKVNGLSSAEAKYHKISRAVLKSLEKKGIIKSVITETLPPPVELFIHPGPELTEEQQQAVQAIGEKLAKFQTFLLYGVTGSGKTEVYFRVIETVLRKNQQALVLVPEIALTPQTVSRFQQRFTTTIAVFHSGLTNRERLIAWQQAAQGQARIIIGTRSAIFTPIPNLGVIVIDEEHDASYKQQEGFRYSARDLAITRAHHAAIPIILGTATPSLESFLNAKQGKYQLLTLPKRAGSGQLPRFHVIDIRNQYLDEGLSSSLLVAIKQHLSNDGQILLFLNRRGFAPNWACHRCGWVARCHRCDANMIFHQLTHHLHCHHCAASHRVTTQCPDCQHSPLIPLGLGTERIELALEKNFPNEKVLRIDRDSMTTKSTMLTKFADIHTGSSRLLIGTQMLAKGHHFPNVSMVGVIDADSGFFSADLRATERIGQLLIQVAGRAGRAEKKGEVWIQTRHPDHPLLRKLINEGYTTFAESILAERQQTTLPPYGHITILRSEANQKEVAIDFLNLIRKQTVALIKSQVNLLGPIPAPMERKAGRFRAQMLIHAQNRQELHRYLSALIKIIADTKMARQIRWSLDVDPLDLS